MSLPTGPAASKRRVVWEYDGQGRRIRQTIYSGALGSYVVTSDLKLLNDGWRCVAELDAADNALVRSYTWGLDLSGSEAVSRPPHFTGRCERLVASAGFVARLRP